MGHGATPAISTVADTRAVIAAIDAFCKCQMIIGEILYYKWVDPALDISRPMTCSSVPNSPNWKRVSFPRRQAIHPDISEGEMDLGRNQGPSRVKVKKGDLSDSLPAAFQILSLASGAQPRTRRVLELAPAALQVVLPPCPAEPRRAKPVPAASQEIPPPSRALPPRGKY